MGYAVTFEEHEAYLVARVAGENTPESLRAYLADIYKACIRTGQSSVLIEENLDGPPLEPIDVYEVLKESSARTSPVVRKIAYVDVSSRHSATNPRLGETVARNRGVNVRVFPDVEAAREWLTAGHGGEKD